MVRVRGDLICEKCGSALCEIVVDDNFHKILIRKCKLNCENDKDILEDYGYSEKMKIKILRKQERLT